MPIVRIGSRLVWKRSVFSACFEEFQTSCKKPSTALISLNLPLMWLNLPSCWRHGLKKAPTGDRQRTGPWPTGGISFLTVRVVSVVNNQCVFFYVSFCNSLVNFLPFYTFGLPVLSLPARVFVCVRVSVNHELISAITNQLFKLGSPNLDQRCERPWLRSLLFLLGDWPWPSRSNWKVKI